MIACPECNAQTSVIETRNVGGSARRRRVCDRVTCNARFTTVEMIVSTGTRQAIADPIVVSRRAIERVVKVLAEGFTGRTGSAAMLELFRKLMPGLTVKDANEEREESGHDVEGTEDATQA